MEIQSNIHLETFATQEGEKVFKVKFHFDKTFSLLARGTQMIV